MTKQETAMFAELTAKIEALSLANAELALRVQALENPQPVRSNGIVRDAKTGLVNKVPKDSVVAKAARTENGYYIVLETGERYDCTEWCAKYWHQRLSAQQQAA